jgi:hypothetical protein
MMDVLNYGKFLMFIYSASSRNRDLFLHPNDAQHSRSIPAPLYHYPACIPRGRPMQQGL